MQEKIRPIYLQLQGYLNQLPKSEDKYADVETKQTWEGYHRVIDNLSEILGENLDDFKLEIKSGGGDSFQSRYNYVNLNNFRFQLGGLISRLYGQYFSDERNPLDGSPSTVINTTQNQSQTVQLEIAIEMTELITKKLLNYKDGTKERTFLEQVKDGLRGGKNVVELIDLILKTGAALGLTAVNMISLLSK